MKTILIIEDEQAIRSNIARILHHGNYQVIEAANGEEGVTAAKGYLPDLIICDIMMPVLDGYQVFRALSEDAETAIIPFIFLSAKADRSDQRQGMILGADDYLTKPFTSAELLQAITARLSKKASVTDPYVHEMKRTVASLSQAAYSDPLTGLPNRILLRHRLQELLRPLKQQRSSTLVAVFSLNIRRFRDVNSIYGQSVGDMLLNAVGERLTAIAGDDRIVARLGGNEFCLVWSDILVPEDVEVVARQIIDQMQQPYEVGDHRLSVRMNVGVALYPTHGDTPDLLLPRAETAEHWGQREGKGYQLYDPVMTQMDQSRRQLEQDLQQAIAQLEFELHYQPQVNVITGRLIGVEALLRWNHPTRGLLHPADFMAVAEEAGLMTAIGEWVLATAVTQIKLWQDSSLAPLKISINVSARQFQHANFVPYVTRVLQETELEPSALMLELTETSLMADIEETVQTLTQLKDMGVGIAIDDFGTGYSSLANLKRLPLSLLKIDQSFVWRITQDPQDAAITSAIIAMAQSLGLKVIAEGVETKDQLAFLKKQGCYAIQGFICSSPLPVGEVAAMLERPSLLPT
jgi:diguanylate cyclase (GGDEF)-like protein